MPKRIWPIVLLFLIWFPGISGEEVTRETILSNVILKGLQSLHYHPLEINTEFSKKAFQQFLKNLDAAKNFLIQDDMQKLLAFQDKIDEEWEQGKSNLARLGQSLVLTRIRQIADMCRECLQTPFDFSQHESIEIDPKKRPFAQSLTELKEHWRKLLKYYTLVRLVELQKGTDKKKSPATADKDLELQARKALQKSLDRSFAQLLQEQDDEVFSRYLNSLISVFDPHSDYFPPRQKENFDIEMTGTFEGIGAQLGEENGFIKIAAIIPGSPSAKQKDLKAEDIILKVAQGNDDAVDVMGMRTVDAVKLIRGKRGTEVRLTIKKPDGRIMVVAIIRDVIVIEETYARSAILKHEPSAITYGYIYLPKFYHDIHRNGGPNAAADTKLELEKLQASSVSGMILDLRENTGGALDDAIKISGLFTKAGPVVQVKDRDNESQVLSSRNDAALCTLPLVVLVDVFSASASEIVAAALQDYGRAVIVGSAQTFGKGTVQAMIDLDQVIAEKYQEKSPFGAMTMTIQKFYRINGGSTQYRGVIPDIILPDPWGYLEIGERYLDYSQPYDTIKNVAYEKQSGVIPFDPAALAQLSKQRCEKSQNFKEIVQYVERMKKNRANSMQTLELTTYRQQQQELFLQADAFNKKKNADVHVTITEPAALPGNTANSRKGLDAEKKKEWFKTLQQDLYIDEAMNILGDMLAGKK